MATVFNKLSEAIRRKKRVRIDYEPVHPEKGLAGKRVIEPHAMGMSKKGKKYIVRAWVSSGESYSGAYPSWRLFRAENITDAIILENTTFKVRPRFNAADKQMSHIPRRITVTRGATAPTRRSTRIAQARAPSRRRRAVQRN